jgi:hypothetical protein
MSGKGTEASGLQRANPTILFPKSNLTQALPGTNDLPGSLDVQIVGIEGRVQ